MARTTDPETYLRLACERILLAQDWNKGIPDDAEATVIGRACVAAGTLDQATAHAVLDEYAFSMALRDGRRGHMFMHGRILVRGDGQRLSAHRVAICDDVFQQGDQQWVLERVLFADDATHLDLSGVAPMGFPGNQRRRSGLVRPAPGMMHQHPNPQTLVIGDDQGTTATGHVGSSRWGGGSWDSTYRTDVPLSPDTQWIEVDGTRIELPQRTPAPEVHVEEIEPMDPLRAMLYGEILSPDRQHRGGDSVEIACRTLIAIGALDENDPLLVETRRIADALTSAAPVPGLSEPWASLLGRYSQGDGLTGRLAVGAVIDDLEGFSIRLDALVSEPGLFSISLAMSPGAPLLRHFAGQDLDRVPIVWWAEDDRNNAYVAFSDRGGGSGDLAEGQVTSLAPLDPKAAELKLLPTASHSRAVVTVPLAALADHS
jgi:hypothetical protein